MAKVTGVSSDAVCGTYRRRTSLTRPTLTPFICTVVPAVSPFTGPGKYVTYVTTGPTAAAWACACESYNSKRVPLDTGSPGRTSGVMNSIGALMSDASDAPPIDSPLPVSENDSPPARQKRVL